MNLLDNSEAEFTISIQDFKNKLKGIKAFISDWDGVFNTGIKGEGSPSLFAEADSMGTNLLRFTSWLKNDKQMPYFAIITGANNPASLKFAKREHLQAVYMRVFDKSKALEHFCKTHQLQPKEVAFFFDDANDLIMAKDCGLRCLVKRKASPYFTEFVKKNQLCDYVSTHEGGNMAIREICEMLMFLKDGYDEALQERATLSETYKTYFKDRQMLETQFFEDKDGKIEKVKE